MNTLELTTLVAGCCLSSTVVWADSTIDTTNRYAYGANIGWIDWRADGTNGAVIGASSCSGFLYGANIGWLNLGHGPTNGVMYSNTSTNDFGVNLDGSGNLSGYAYGANIGWINFETTGAPKVDLVTGNFSGYAYGANVGWISLSNAHAFVRTAPLVSAPSPIFAGSPSTGTAPLSVTFTDSSTGSITNRLWDFGDGGSSTTTATSVGHTYTNSGDYTVSLTVFGPGGSSNLTRSSYIVVTNTPVPPPVPGFTASPTNGTVSLLVNFTDASTGIITNRLWNFGDGGTSSVISPTHTYTNPGLYSVSLTVFGPGGSNALNRTNLITVTEIVVEAPVAAFTASPTNGTVPLLVSFADASTGTITNRQWDFGDGGTSTETSPSHTYTNPGTYSVSLTVFGPLGSNTLSQTNLITAAPIPPPVADFSANPTNGLAPLQVNFTDMTGGPVTNRVWNFGDGGSSELISPSHTYTNPGTYTVSLTAFGPGGSNTLTRTSLITATGVANLELLKVGSPDTVMFNEQVTYTLTVTNRGPHAASDVTIVDELPEEATFLAASTGCAETNGVVSCELGVLGNGAVTNVTITVIGAAVGTFTNVAEVSSADFDPDLTNNVAEAITTVSEAPLTASCALTPQIATNFVGSIHTLTASVATNGAAAEGVAVDFEVISGPNAGETGADITDTNGDATFPYSGDGGPGTDIIRATGTVGGNAFTCTATKVWLALDVACSLTPASDTNQVGALHNLTSTVTTNSNPATGVTVHFQVITGPNAGVSGSAVTDAGGQAAFQYAGNGGIGTDTIAATGSVSSASFACEAGKVWVQGPCANLTGTWTKVSLKCKAKDGVPSCKLSGSLSVLNNGNLDAAPSEVKYYLSDDAQVDTNDTLIITVPLKAVKVGKIGKSKLKVTLTGSNPSGRVLLGVVDSSGVISECNESDNVAVFGQLSSQ